MRHVRFFFLSGLAMAAVATAQGPPMSPEIPVNTYATGQQRLSSVAIDGPGNFVVTWQSAAGDGDGYGISARRFDTGGNPLGPEFVVNTYTTGDQYQPAVAADHNGNFVVIWSSFRQLAPLGSDVFGRLYDSSGTARGAEFQVNTHTADYQFTLGQTVAMSGSGDFVVVWTSNDEDGDGAGIFAQRYDAAGNKLGGEFEVNTHTTGAQQYPVVSVNDAHQFVVAWESYGQDGDDEGVVARLYDANGTAVGGEIAVNSHTTGAQELPSVGIDGSGNFVVVWQGPQDGSGTGVAGRRFDATGAPLTADFPVNTYTASDQSNPAIAVDPEGNFVCTWQSRGQDGANFGVYAQAFDSSATKVGTEFLVETVTTNAQTHPAIATRDRGNFVVTWGSAASGTYDVKAKFSAPAAHFADVDARSVTGTASNANGVLESGETVQVAPRYRNELGSSISVSGTASNIGGPAGPAYTLNDTTADYGTITASTTNDCFDASGNCYLVTVSGTRPAAHWDAHFDETLSTGITKTWILHVGGSFPDVPLTNPFYAYIENIFHNGITGGCGGGDYCPDASVTRAQMAVFLEKTEHGAEYIPPACAGVFTDVSCPSQFADWIEQLFHEGITGGCGGGDYCPDEAVTRAQMAVFLLKVEHGSSYAPPACAGLFEDVPCPSQFANWIEELDHEGITGGCGGGDYCPGNSNTRGQMAVFLVKTFSLPLYGP
jgi:hypothetical protein